MTLIIGVRCRNGCLVIADRRCHVTTAGIRTFEDNFTKAVHHGDYIVYNHGYNQIGEADWKLRVNELSPDPASPIYAEVLSEMAAKPDQHAAYVFMNKTTLLEISIRVGAGIRLTDHMPMDRIVSGDGDKYVRLTLLADLPQAPCRVVRPKLVSTFQAAHARMRRAAGTEFSETYEVLRI